jgi:MtaA/CmuA family methyltransferase
MNSIERVCAVFEGRWPDKRPIILHNFMLAAREAGIKIRDYCTNPELAARAHIQAVEKYDLDGVMLDIDTAVLAGAVGVPVTFPEDEPARARGAMLSTLEEVDGLEPVDISMTERVQMELEAARILIKYFGKEKFIRGNVDQAPFSLASMVRTPSEWMMDLLVDEERCFRLLDFCLSACLQFIRLMADTGVHMISNGDSPAGPDMVSPELYRKYALPYEKKLAEEAHAFNLPYMMHICGNTDLILEDMKTAGFDGVELDYKTNIQLIHSLYKDSLVLSGNIDPSGVIALGTARDVEIKARELLSLYADSPRFIMNAGCAIPPTTPEENIRTLVRVTREY